MWYCSGMLYTKRAMIFAAGSVSCLFLSFLPGLNSSSVERVALQGLVVFSSLALIFGTVDLIRFIRDKRRASAQTDDRPRWQ